MPVVSPVIGGLGTLVLNVFDGIGTTLDIFTTSARGVIQFLTGVFAGDWEGAWETVKSTFAGIWERMPDFIKEPIRAIIGFVNKMISGIESGINFVIRGLNMLSFDVPDWVPGIGGETFGFDIGEVSLPRIPELAKGGIVTSPTIALLGEAGAEAVVPLKNNTGWTLDVSRSIVREITGGVVPVLNVGIDVDKYKPKLISADVDGLSDQVFGEVRVQMSALQEDIRRQNRLMEDIIDAIDRKELQIGDDEIFQSTRRAQQRFQKRTNRTGWAGI